MLFVICYLLCVMCYVLCVMCCVLCVVCCVLRACCVLRVVCVACVACGACTCLPSINLPKNNACRRCAAIHSALSEAPLLAALDATNSAQHATQITHARDYILPY